MATITDNDNSDLLILEDDSSTDNMIIEENVINDDKKSSSDDLITFEKENIQNLEEILKKHNVSYSLIGEFTGNSIQFSNDSKPIIDLSVDKAQKTWFNSLREMVLRA